MRHDDEFERDSLLVCIREQKVIPATGEGAVISSAVDEIQALVHRMRPHQGAYITDQCIKFTSLDIGPELAGFDF